MSTRRIIEHGISESALSVRGVADLLEDLRVASTELDDRCSTDADTEHALAEARALLTDAEGKLAAAAMWMHVRH